MPWHGVSGNRRDPMVICHVKSSVSVSHTWLKGGFEIGHFLARGLDENHENLNEACESPNKIDIKTGAIDEVP